MYFAYDLKILRYQFSRVGINYCLKSILKDETIYKKRCSFLRGRFEYLTYWLYCCYKKPQRILKYVFFRYDLWKVTHYKLYSTYKLLHFCKVGFFWEGNFRSNRCVNTNPDTFSWKILRLKYLIICFFNVGIRNTQIFETETFSNIVVFYLMSIKSFA